MIRSSLRLLIREMIGTARWRLAWTLALITFISLTEGIGVALLLPTLSAAGMNLGSESAASHYAQIMDAGLRRLGLHSSFVVLLALCAAVLVTRSILNRECNVSSWTVQQEIGDAVRRRLYKAIANADWLFIARSRQSDFTHALTSEIERIEIAASSALMLAADLILAVLYAGLAMLLSASMTAIMFASGAVIALLLRARTRRIEQKGSELAEHNARLYAAAGEHLAALKAAKTYCAEERNYEIFSGISRQIAATNVAAAREQSAATSWFELGGWTVMLPLLYGAVYVLRIPPAEILILLGLFWRLMPRFQSVHRYYRTVVNYLPSLSNVFALEQRCIAAAEHHESLTGRAITFRREIRLDDVSFSYGSGDQQTIKHVTIAIDAGTAVAIVGPSGAGKSTIADLVMGLIHPDSGRVLIDGIAHAGGAIQRWRERIGYVGPETPLFHLSVRDNLLWARPSATDDEIRDALEMAAASEFVRALPDGMKTIVGDRGVLISQGERQRLALARAILRRPDILILDEATNSLDYDSEAKVLNAINSLRGNMTVLMIAHRLSTIRWADLIYVVEAGRIVESGGWNELNARSGGRFRALCDAQRLVA